MKQTRIYGDKLLGFHNRINGDVAVNLSLIWNVSYDMAEDYCIEKFAQVMLHEQLHRIIYDLGFHNDKFDYGEESIVRKLCGMPFTQQEQGWYK